MTYHLYSPYNCVHDHMIAIQLLGNLLAFMTILRSHNRNFANFFPIGEAEFPWHPSDLLNDCGDSLKNHRNIGSNLTYDGSSGPNCDSKSKTACIPTVIIIPYWSNFQQMLLSLQYIFTNIGRNILDCTVFVTVTLNAPGNLHKQSLILKD